MRRFAITFLAGLSVLASGTAMAAKSASKPAAKAPDLTFYGPVIDTCAHWTESKDEIARKIYAGAVLGELTGLENMCRLAKPGTLPFPCTDKKIQNAGGFVKAVEDTCKINPPHRVAEVTFVVWKSIATHDVPKEGEKKAKSGAKNKK